MDTPICHRTIGPERHWNNLSDEERTRGAVAEKGPCIGSRCAMWVPSLDADGEPAGEGLGGFWANPENRDRPNGLGWCADNLRRAPWADPAKDGAK